MARTLPYSPYRQQASVGIDFQPTYDPTFDQNIGALIQQEGQKAQAAMAGIQAQEAAMGDIFSYDIEGREKRISDFKSKTGAIKERFGNDLAQAAPALAQAVVAERANPWYQKNKLYTKEYERRQKLVDQFGPNLITLKDLPEGDLANIAMDDIKYEAINRQQLHQIWKQQLGGLGDRISDLGLAKVPGFEGMLKSGQLKGLTETQRLELVKSYGPMIDEMLAERGWPNTPENRDMLAAEFDQWTQQLVGGEQFRYMQAPNSGGSGTNFGGLGKIPTRDFAASDTNVEVINFNPEEIEALKQSRAWRTGAPMTADDPNLPTEVADAIKNDQTYQEIVANEPLFTGSKEDRLIQDELSGFNNLSSEKQQEVLDYLNQELRRDFQPVTRGMKQVGITGTKEQVDVIQEHLKNEWGVSFTDMGAKNLGRKIDTHTSWLQNEYRPKEKEIIKKGPTHITESTVFTPQAEAEKELVSTLDTYVNSGILKEFTYFDKDLKTETKKRKGFKNLEDLLSEGYDMSQVAIVRGTHKSPNIFQLTLQKGDGKQEVVRIAPNSANSGPVIRELSTILQNPTYMYAEKSKQMWDYMQSKDTDKDKLTIGDILNIPNVTSEYHIEQIKRNGRTTFALVESANPTNIIDTDDDLAYLADSWMLNSGDEDFRLSYLGSTIAYDFYSRIYAENMSAKDIKEASIGHILQTVQ